MQQIVLLLLLVTFALPESYGRVWTDKQGRTIDAEFISATKYKVKVRRTSDSQYFEILLSSLSYGDQEFAASEWEESESQKELADFERRQGGSKFKETFKTEDQSEVLGQGEFANRLSIPSLSREELGSGYPSGPSCIVNFLVWWGDTIAPESMPHKDREKAIRKIAEDLEDYFNDDSNSLSNIWRGIDKYSEKKMDGFELRWKSPHGPQSMKELQQLTSGWDGVIALFGFYEERGGVLHRQGGRYSSVAKADEHSVIHNLMGKQYIMTVVEGDDLAKPKRRDGDKMVQFDNGSQQKNGFVPEGMVALLEGVIVFEIRKISKEDKRG